MLGKLKTSTSSRGHTFLGSKELALPAKTIATTGNRGSKEGLNALAEHHEIAL